MIITVVTQPRQILLCFFHNTKEAAVCNKKKKHDDKIRPLFHNAVKVADWKKHDDLIHRLLFHSALEVADWKKKTKSTYLYFTVVHYLQRYMTDMQTVYNNTKPFSLFSRIWTPCYIQFPRMQTPFYTVSRKLTLFNTVFRKLTLLTQFPER